MAEEQIPLHSSLTHRHMTDQEHWIWKHGVVIGDHLPYTFPNDQFVLKVYEPVCPTCDQRITDKTLVRGTMIQVLDAVLMIRAVCYCPSCQSYGASVTRIRATKDDYSIESLGHDSAWVRTKFVQKHPIQHLFRSLLGRIIRKTTMRTKPEVSTDV